MRLGHQAEVEEEVEVVSIQSLSRGQSTYSFAWRAHGLVVACKISRLDSGAEWDCGGPL